MLRWSWVAATTEVPSRLMASPLLPAFAMNVVKAPVAGVYWRMSDGCTFWGPVPSCMFDNSRVWVAASQTGPSRKLKPSLTLVAARFVAGNGFPNGPPGQGLAGAADAPVTTDPARTTATTTPRRSAVSDI